jgi:hypothetical protein
MHNFIIMEDGDIFTIDNAAEIAEARDRMKEDGVASLPIYVGEAGEEGTLTGRSLDAETEECTDDAPEVPSDADLAEMLMALVNPENGEDERAEVIERLEAIGLHTSVTSFRSAGVLTNNAGFVLRIGSTSFQITVVS